MSRVLASTRGLCVLVYANSTPGAAYIASTDLQLILLSVRLPCLLTQPQAAAPASKGFGAPAKKVKKEKTAAQIEREKAASAYDNLAASGIPEYNIFVKVKVSSASKLLRERAHLKLTILRSNYRLNAKLQVAANCALARDRASPCTRHLNVAYA
jgi:Family of unknown function (DUF6523)